MLYVKEVNHKFSILILYSIMGLHVLIVFSKIVATCKSAEMNST